MGKEIKHDNWASVLSWWTFKKRKIGGGKGEENTEFSVRFAHLLFLRGNSVEVSSRHLGRCTWNSGERAGLGMESSAGGCLWAG